MEIPNRAEIEKRFGVRLVKLTSKHRKELRKLLGNPPDISRVTPAFWARVEKETEEEVLTLLLLLFMASASFHIDKAGGDFSEAQSSLLLRSQTYSATRATAVAKQYVKGSQESLANRAEEWEPTTQQTEAGETITTPPTKGEVDAGAVKVFGPAKAERIAVSETTDAQSEGGEAAMGFLNLIAADDLWRTEDDARVCPICEPLHLTRRPVWSSRFPNGPKAHERCRCWIDYAATAGNDKVKG